MTDSFSLGAKHSSSQAVAAVLIALAIILVLAFLAAADQNTGPRATTLITTAQPSTSLYSLYSPIYQRPNVSVQALSAELKYNNLSTLNSSNGTM